MGTLKDWLTFHRLHTAALTQGVFLLGYLLAGGELFSWGAMKWIIYGTLFHGVGFGMNNLFDLPWDRKDPSKRLHPLVNGRISEAWAWTAIIMLFTVLILWGVIITVTSQNMAALVLLIFCIINGLIYNAVSKTKLWASVPISLTFGPLVLVSYLAEGGQPNTLIYLVTAYMIGQIWWQIAVSGYLKEILEMGQVNLLRELGFRVVYMPRSGSVEVDYGVKGFLFCVISKMPVFLLIPIAQQMMHPLMPMAWVLASIALILAMMEIRPGEWNRDKRLLLMTLVEIMTFYGLIVTVSPIIGGKTAIVLMAYLTAWFMGLNRLYWNTWLKPRV